MAKRTVLIVEDDVLISLNVEMELTDAGFDVCGRATSESEALSLAKATRPEFAVVDVDLSPGDGRNVARELSSLYGTTILMATGQCRSGQGLDGLGASACLPKPYDAQLVVSALKVASAIKAGRDPGPFPDHLLILH